MDILYLGLYSHVIQNPLCFKKGRGAMDVFRNLQFKVPPRSSFHHSRSKINKVVQRMYNETQFSETGLQEAMAMTEQVFVQRDKTLCWDIFSRIISFSVFYFSFLSVFLSLFLLLAFFLSVFLPFNV